MGRSSQPAGGEVLESTSLLLLPCQSFLLQSVPLSPSGAAPLLLTRTLSRALCQPEALKRKGEARPDERGLGNPPEKTNSNWKRHSKCRSTWSCLFGNVCESLRLLWSTVIQYRVRTHSRGIISLNIYTMVVFQIEEKNYTSSDVHQIGIQTE